MEVGERVTQKWLGISRPNKGTGQASMTRTEREKNRPARMLESGRVLGGKEKVPSTPATEIGDGAMGWRRREGSPCVIRNEWTYLLPTAVPWAWQG